MRCRKPYLGRPSSVEILMPEVKHGETPLPTLRVKHLKTLLIDVTSCVSTMAV